jgi:hypothetical protein
MRNMRSPFFLEIIEIPRVFRNMRKVRTIFIHFRPLTLTLTSAPWSLVAPSQNAKWHSGGTLEKPRKFPSILPECHVFLITLFFPPTRGIFQPISPSLGHPNSKSAKSRPLHPNSGVPFSGVSSLILPTPRFRYILSPHGNIPFRRRCNFD